MKIYPHHPLYHIPYQKAKNSFLCGANIIKLLRVFIDEVVFSFLSERVFFRFLIYRILFRVLSDRVFLESSMIGSTSGSAVIYSSLTSSVPFFRHLFNQILLPPFYQKQMFCFTLYSQKEVRT